MADNVLVTKDLKPYLDSVESYLDGQPGPAVEQSERKDADSKLSDAGDSAHNHKRNGTQQNIGEGQGKGHSNGSGKKNGT